MTSDNKIALYQSALERGAMPPEQQIAAAADFAEFIIEFRRMQHRLDQIANDSVLDELERAEAEAIRRSLPVADVLPFPRRPLPVRLAAVPVVAATEETWR